MTFHARKILTSKNWEVGNNVDNIGGGGGLPHNWQILGMGYLSLYKQSTKVPLYVYLIGTSNDKQLLLSTCFQSFKNNLFNLNSKMFFNFSFTSEPISPSSVGH